MDAPTVQYPQNIVMKPLDEMIASKARSDKARVALNCPRCNSTNTKFCYYNNYSLSQPRHFCKRCRRYWTLGGSLRNIPFGGASRKNKIGSSSSFNCSYSKKPPNLVSLSIPQQNPILETPKNHFKTSSANSSSPRVLSSSFLSFQGYNSAADAAAATDFSTVSSIGFINPLCDEELGSNSGSSQGVQEANRKPVFLFQDLKYVPSNEAEQNRDKHRDLTGYNRIR